MFADTPSPQGLESVGKDFSLERLLAARGRTWDALARIAQDMKPGLTEQEAIKRANGILADMGARKLWHRTHVRFGPSTLLSFDDPYSEEVVLQEGDLFTLDIGPVFDGYEGDAGATYLTAPHPDFERLRSATKEVFDAVQDHWRNTRASGAALYEFAQAQAHERGYQLAPAYVRGHRVSDFPHKVHFNGTLEECTGTPAAHIWVLEIQLACPRLGRGAFYEDLLFS